MDMEPPFGGLYMQAYGLLCGALYVHLPSPMKKARGHATGALVLCVMRTEVCHRSRRNPVRGAHCNPPSAGILQGVLHLIYMRTLLQRYSCRAYADC